MILPCDVACGKMSRTEVRRRSKSRALRLELAKPKESELSDSRSWERLFHLF